MPKIKKICVVCDHCRIGSLEIFRRLSVELSLDHCRIGSLEKAGSG